MLRSLFRRPAPAALVYYLASGAMALIHSTIFTVYVVYFVQSVDLNPLQLVLVGTVLELTVLVFEVPTGVVADTYSRRLSVIVGIFFLGASSVLVGAVPVFAVILFGQVISGVGYTFLSGAFEAWLAGEVGEAEVGRVLVRAGQVRRAAGLAGILVSVALASVSLNWPYLVGGAGYIALSGLLLLIMPEQGFAPAPRGERGTWGAMLGIFREGAQSVRRSPVLLVLLGVSMVVGAASEGFDRLADAHLLANFAFPALGALQPVVWFGIISATTSLLSLAVVEVFRARLEAVTRDRAATARLLLALSAVAIASVVTFAVTGSFALAFVVLAVKAVSESIAGPLYENWLIQSIHPKVRATVISMAGQSNAIGQIAGGPGIGYLGTAVSLRAAMAATGLLLAPAIGLYARVLDGGALASGAPEEQAAMPEA